MDFDPQLVGQDVTGMGFRFQIRRVEEPHHLNQQKPFGEDCELFKKIDQLRFGEFALFKPFAVTVVGYYRMRMNFSLNGLPKFVEFLLLDGIHNNSQLLRFLIPPSLFQGRFLLVIGTTAVFRSSFEEIIHSHSLTDRRFSGVKIRPRRMPYNPLLFKRFSRTPGGAVLLKYDPFTTPVPAACRLSWRPPISAVGLGIF